MTTVMSEGYVYFLIHCVSMLHNQQEDENALYTYINRTNTMQRGYMTLKCTIGSLNEGV